MVNENKEIKKVEREVIGTIDIPTELLESMQSAIDLCVPATSKAMQTLSDSIIIGNGLNQLREFFKNPEGIFD